MCASLRHSSDRLPLLNARTDARADACADALADAFRADENLLTFVHLADYYGVPQLLRRTHILLEEFVTVGAGNCCAKLAEATALRCMQAQEHCRGVLLHDFAAAMRQPAFASLELSVFAAILEDNELRRAAPSPPHSACSDRSARSARNDQGGSRRRQGGSSRSGGSLCSHVHRRTRRARRCDREEVAFEGLIAWWEGQAPTPPVATLDQLLPLIVRRSPTPQPRDPRVSLMLASFDKERSLTGASHAPAAGDRPLRPHTSPHLTCPEGSHETCSPLPADA